MSEYEIVDTHAGNIGGCSFCGRKDPNNEGYRRKLAWLKKRYPEGLKLKVLRSRESGDIGTIEYVPGHQAWRPVEADGYLVIHCLMVTRQHGGKGVGTALLDSFMAENALFVKAGFVSVDSFPPYELLVKKLKKGAPDPRFIVDRERLLKRYKKGLTILAADQCPMVPKWVAEIAEAARALGLEPKVVRVSSAEASRELPTPYGMFSIIYDGKLIAERPVSARRFSNIMSEAGGIAKVDGLGDGP